jgi:hypothetical protein
MHVPGRSSSSLDITDAHAPTIPDPSQTLDDTVAATIVRFGARSAMGTSASAVSFTAFIRDLSGVLVNYAASPRSLLVLGPVGVGTLGFLVSPRYQTH